MDEFLLRLQTKVSKDDGDRVVHLESRTGVFFSKIPILLFDAEEIRFLLET